MFESVTTSSKHNYPGTFRTAMMKTLVLVLACCICGMTATPDAPVNRYKVRDDDNNVCLLAQFALTFDVTYESLADPNTDARFIVPRQAEVNKELSYCSDTNPRLAIEFYDGYNFTVDYELGENSNNIELGFTVGIWTLGYKLDKKRFPDAAHPDSTVVVTRNINVVVAGVGESWKCESRLVAQMQPAYTSTIRDLQVQPMGVENGKFGPVFPCREDAALEAPVVNYEVLDDDNNVCILAQFSLTFYLEYQTLTDPLGVRAYFVVPEDATVNQELSSCSDTFAKLVIEFYEDYNFTVTFDLTDDNMYTFADFILGYTMNEERFPGAVDLDSTVLATMEINTPIAEIGESYWCETRVRYNKESIVFMKDTHVQPFAVENGDYGPATHCYLDGIGA